MRAVFGLVGLVVALAVVGVVAKKQMSAMRAPVPALQTTAPASAPIGGGSGTVRDQSQQMQQQVKQQVESLMQQARPMPDEEK
jgi:hypothetical protein